MAHFHQFRGRASRENEDRRMLMQHHGDIQKIWRRLSQTPDYNQMGSFLGGSGANQPTSTASGGSGSGFGGPSGSGGGSGTLLMSGACSGAIAAGNTGTFYLSAGMGGGSVTALVPMGIAIENPDPSSNNISYQIGKFKDGTYEVLNATRTFFGKTSGTGLTPTDCTSGANVSFEVDAGSPGTEGDTTITVDAYVPKGVIFAGKRYVITVTAEGTYEVINPSLLIRGKPGSDIAAGATGSMVIWTGGSGGVASSVTVTGIRNDSSCPVKASKLAYAAWCDSLAGWVYGVFSVT